MDNIIKGFSDKLYIIGTIPSNDIEYFINHFQKQSIEYTHYYDGNKHTFITNNNARTLNHLGHCYHIVGNYKLMAKMYKLIPENCLQIEHITRLINYFKEEKTDNEIIKYYELGKNKDVELAYDAAKYYQTKKIHPEAVNCYNLCLEKNKFDVCYDFGKYYESINDIENAEKYYQIGINHDKKNCLNALTNLYKNSDNYEKKIELYLSLSTNTNIDEPIVFEELGNYHYKNNKIIDAVNCYARAISLGSKNTNIMNFLGNYYEKKLSSDNAKYYHRLAADRGHIKSMLWYAKLQQACGNTRYMNYYDDIINHSGFNSLDKETLEELSCIYYEFKNISAWIKCEKILIEKGHKTSIDLARYFVKYDKLEAEKYFQKSIEEGNKDGAIELHNLYMSLTYCTIDNILYLYKYINILGETRIVQLIDKYFQKASSMENITGDLINVLCDIDLTKANKAPVYIQLLQKSYKSKLDLLEIHFKYAPTSEGYNEAKKNFMQLLKDNEDENK